MSGVASIDNLIQHFQSFEERIDSIIRQALEENESAVIGLNIYTQLYDEGIRSDGKPVKPDYHPNTIQIKLERDPPQPTDRVTLRDTGNFHESFVIVFEEDSFYITSTDSKTEKLTSRYGKKIFGLTEENWTKIIKQYVAPLVEYELKNFKK